MDKNLTIVKVGTKATTAKGNIQGMITACNIRFNNAINYEFSYFYNGEIRIIWLFEEEFELINPDKINVGFK